MAATKKTVANTAVVKEAVKPAVEAKEVKAALPAAEEVKKETAPKKAAETAAKKAPAKKAPARKAPAKKAPAAKNEIKAAVYVQYAGKEVAAQDLLAAAKKAYIAAGHKEEDIETINVYVKPEENAAYFAVNGEGSDDFKVEY